MPPARSRPATGAKSSWKEKLMSSSYKGGGGSPGGPVMFYGVVIHDCIRRGNEDEMKQVLADAKKHHQEQGDLGTAIKELEAALAKK
jgi:hypothetical protein